jgi:hypothetical protein
MKRRRIAGARAIAVGSAIALILLVVRQWPVAPRQMGRNATSQPPPVTVVSLGDASEFAGVTFGADLKSFDG